MGEDTTQPTPIDEVEYERFRQYVLEVHGQIRGNLKRELENALREYRMADAKEDQLTRVENDVAHVKAMLSETTDGGETPPTTASESQSTRTRRTDKPAANQPRQDKIEFLIGEICDELPVTPASGQVAKDTLREIIETNYNFGENTVSEYVDAITSELEAEEHPLHGRTWVWGDKYEEAVDELQITDASQAERVE